MPRDSIGNEIVLGTVVRIAYQVVKIDPHADPNDMDADIHLQAVGAGYAPIADFPPVEVHASTVTCESGPPKDWTPPVEETPPLDADGIPLDFMKGGLMPSAGDANDPYKVRDEHRRQFKHAKEHAGKHAPAEGKPAHEPEAKHGLLGGHAKDKGK